MKRVVAFGVHNPVPVNLLMVALIFGGVVSVSQLRRQFFPEIESDAITVTLPYPGATPEEIEETLAIKVEDRLAELDEVRDLTTTIAEGGGGITVRIQEGMDIDEAFDEIEREVDSLLDLPEEAETIQVRTLDPKLPVIRVVVYGDVDEPVLKHAILGVRDDLRSLDDMGDILVEGVRDYEVRVDVRREALVQWGISLPRVAEIVSAWMKEVPGGTVRTGTGNVRVRTMGVEERARTIDQIPIRAESDGRIVRLSDIADVSETVVDEPLLIRFNERPAAGLTIFKIGEQDIVTIAEMVRAYVDGRLGRPFEPTIRERLALLAPNERVAEMFTTGRLRAWRLGSDSPNPLPLGAQIGINTDLARFVEGRLDLLTRNATYGGILVFATLLTFLNWRVALWVGVGLVTALMGTLMLMYSTGITLNLLTMFGLIVVLGLLVDDAIVVSENVQARHDRGQRSLEAAVDGTQEVLWPVVATVMTSIVAFLPLTFIRGQIGDLLGALPMVVACALLMSLVESLLILPSHMGHTLARRDRTQPGRLMALVRRGERFRDRLVLNRLVPAYAWLLQRLLRIRYVAIAVGVSVLIISLGLVAGGRVVFTFLPGNDAETVVIDLRLPVGASIGRTDAAVVQLERAALAQPDVSNVSSVIGQRSNIDTGESEGFAAHVAQMFIELEPVERRERPSSAVIAAIRDAVSGKIDEVERIGFQEITGGPAGPDITLRVRGEYPERIEAAVTELKRMLTRFDGVHDIADDNDAGQLEVQIRLKPGGAALGFTTAEVANQVRGFLFGIDAHVYADREEDIDVRVRLDERSRRSLFAIENVWLISPAGAAVPLTEIAEIEASETYAVIKRVDRQRTVTVTADTALGVSPETITSEMIGAGAGGVSPLDEVRRRYPRLDIAFAGRQEQIGDAFASLPVGFMVAVVLIYIILAVLFSSYLQPIIVLMAVPFAIIGVVWGHLLLGFDLTFLSLIGFVALSGIVVNDSLILVKFYNARRVEGHSVSDALVAAGRAHLRAILLTTITTVLGLTPLILETSFQAHFLIPMAISIAMGLLSATVLILILLPCLILAFDDAKNLLHFLWYGRPREQALPASDL